MYENESNSGEAAMELTDAGAPIVIEEQVRTGGVARHAPLAFVFAIAGWIVPGLGHLLQGRWGRACVFLIAVGGLAVTGLMMRGNVFPPHSDDPFGTLGFLADAGSGAFYYLAHFFESGGADLSLAAGEYGTRLIAAAGIVNILGALDAYEIASGRRS
jgi:hypothetical protein